MGDADHHAGETLGRYQLVEHLGDGAMGSVWKGLHVALKKPVAVKLLREEFGRSPEFRERFVREGEAASRVRHPNVVEIFDVGEERGVAWLAMELLEGECLADKLDREGALPVSEAVDLLLPVLAAVSAAHEEGVVHRDLKPENIFISLTRDGARVPKVLDFGISRVVDDASGRIRTQTDMILGTPQYMAPEQARGDRNIDDRADQYALGAIAYECVTGALAITNGAVYEMLDRVVRGHFLAPRAVRPELPEALESVICRAMSRDPAARFRSLRSFGASLMPFASDLARATWASVFDIDELLLSSPTVVQSAPPFAPPVVAPAPASTPTVDEEAPTDVRVVADTIVDVPVREGTTTPIRRRRPTAVLVGAILTFGAVVAAIIVATARLS
jgi:eukaryotic-like serine/threonine-protein kinase